MPANARTNEPGQGALDQVSEAASGVGDAVRNSASALKGEATRQGAAAVDALKDGAHALGEQARERVAGYAEGQRDVITGHLDTFAEAIRKASDDLSQHDQTLASQVVRQAAGGLESLSRSIHGASFGDVVDSVRAFGRRNPAAFIGGAVLVGFAVGRFARSKGQLNEGMDDDWQSPGGNAGRMRDANGRFVSRGRWDDDYESDKGYGSSFQGDTSLQGGAYRGGPYGGSRSGSSGGGFDAGSAGDV